jgi:hypothetical protein
MHDFLQWLVNAVNAAMRPPALIPVPVTAPATRRPADRR